MADETKEAVKAHTPILPLGNPVTCGLCGKRWQFWVDGCPDCQANVPARGPR